MPYKRDLKINIGNINIIEPHRWEVVSSGKNVVITNTKLIIHNPWKHYRIKKGTTEIFKP